jgi:hypothetical protein
MSREHRSSRRSQISRIEGPNMIVKRRARLADTSSRQYDHVDDSALVGTTTDTRADPATIPWYTPAHGKERLDSNSKTLNQ